MSTEPVPSLLRFTAPAMLVMPATPARPAMTAVVKLVLFISTLLGLTTGLMLYRPGPHRTNGIPRLAVYGNRQQQRHPTIKAAATQPLEDGPGDNLSVPRNHGLGGIRGAVTRDSGSRYHLPCSRIQCSLTCDVDSTSRSVPAFTLARYVTSITTSQTS